MFSVSPWLVPARAACSAAGRGLGLESQKEPKVFCYLAGVGRRWEFGSHATLWIWVCTFTETALENLGGLNTQTYFEESELGALLRKGVGRAAQC